MIAAALLCLSQAPTCRQVRALFVRYHVRYKIVEISNNPPAIAYMNKRFGDTSVPRTVINGVVVAGYDEQRLRQLLCLD